VGLDSLGSSEKVWIADAHRDDGKRYVARADEKLTTFVELESAIRCRQSIKVEANRQPLDVVLG
jgi:hypothetical protein